MQQDDSSHREHDSSPDGSAPLKQQALPQFEEATVISDQSPLPVKGDSSPDSSMANLSPADLGRVLLGQRLAHYELREFVGGGGMGAVFRAHDTQLDRTVALKILSRGQGADDAMLRRFRNEAQSAARLDHEYIARVYFFGEDRGLHYIVFEFIEGINIRDMVVQNGPLSIEQALSYTIQIAEALSHAHGRNVVHRDIKPSNIIVTDEGRAKLVDMGLARLHQVQRADDDLTASGVTLGTFDYISPEQARDPRNADVRSDIYSLGCTLYYMLSGRPPFPEGTVLQKLLQHQGDDVTDPREWNADIPDDLWSVMRRMLAKDPRRRYQTPTPLLLDLMPIANQYGIPLAGGSAVPWQLVEPPAPSFLDRHIAWILPVVLLLIAAGAAQFIPLRPVEIPPARRTILNDSSLTAATLANRPIRSDSEVEPDTSHAPSILSAPVSETIVPLDVELEGLERTQRTEQHTVVSPDDVATPSRSDQSPDGAARSVVSHAAPEGMKRRVAADGSGSLDDDEHEGDVPAKKQSPLPSPSDFPTETRNEAATNAPAELDSSPSSLSPNGNDVSPELATDQGTDRELDDPSREPDGSASDEPEIRVADQRSRLTVSVLDPVAEPGLLIVDPTESGRGVYDTLNAACRAATSGDVIELRFTGTITIEPIHLQEINLTIRAGSGYQPIVRYEPPPPRGAAPRRSLFALGGGRLTLVGVGFELRLPPDVPSDSWSLLRVAGAEAVRVGRCTLTVTQLPDDPATQAAFFRLEEAPVLTSAGILPASEIELRDCIVRGEADLIRIKGTVAVSLEWSNGLLASSRRLLDAVGTGRQVGEGREGISIELNHVTAAMREGLCRLNVTPEAAPLVPTKIRVTNCILVVDPKSPLIEERGVMRASELRKHVQWQGDRNFYEGFETFWAIHGLNQDDEPQEMTLRTWQSFWGGGEDNLPNYRRVGWKTPPPFSRPFHTHVPSDYALNDSPSLESAARNAASDGFDAGFRVDRLPSPRAGTPLNPDISHQSP